MKRGVVGFFLCILVCGCLLCFWGCGDARASQTDFTKLDMSLYGRLSPDALQEITLTIPQSCRYSEEKWEEYLTALWEAYPKVTYLNEGVMEGTDTICFYYSLASSGEILSAYGEGDGSPLEIQLEHGIFMGVEDFASFLVGHPLGEEISFTISIKDDHTIPFLAGKEVTFTITPVAIRCEEVVTAFDSDYILNTLGWQTEISDPEEVVNTFVTTLKEEFILAYEEDVYHATEDALMAYLKGVYTPVALPMEDVSYHFHALLNYYETMRQYDNEILETWGSGEGISPTITDYLIRSFSCGAIEGYQTLIEMAKGLTEENLVIAAAFHALGLTITQGEYEEMKTLLTEELGEVPEEGYVNNVLMYEKTVAALLDSNRIKIVYLEH